MCTTARRDRHGGWACSITGLPLHVKSKKLYLGLTRALWEGALVLAGPAAFPPLPGTKCEPARPPLSSQWWQQHVKNLHKQRLANIKKDGKRIDNAVPVGGAWHVAVCCALGR